MRIVGVFVWMLLGVVLATPVAGAADDKAEKEKVSVQVTITGLRSDDGILAVNVFDNGEGFPGEEKHSIQTYFVDINDGKAKCDVVGLKPGTYAITVHHDEDGDGKMKLRLGIIPREGVGASNNAKMKFGPPKWKDAKFELGDETVVQRIEMKYL